MFLCKCNLMSRTDHVINRHLVSKTLCQPNIYWACLVHIAHIPRCKSIWSNWIVTTHQLSLSLWKKKKTKKNNDVKEYTQQTQWNFWRRARARAHASIDIIFLAFCDRAHRLLYVCHSLIQARTHTNPSSKCIHKDILYVRKRVVWAKEKHLCDATARCTAKWARKKRQHKISAHVNVKPIQKRLKMLSDYNV